MIIEWPQNGQFNNHMTDVFTSRTTVRRLDDNDDAWPLGCKNDGIIPLLVVRMMFFHYFWTQNIRKHHFNNLQHFV